MFAPGAVIAGKYRMERVLGRGGMGVVVAASHLQLGNTVALKFLHKGIDNPQLIERFLREARATAQLGSEHICRVFDVGLHENVPYLVMEMLEGTDLSKVLRKQRQLSVGEACDLMIQACAGISEAHAAKIVHRDIKPGNLFLTPRNDGTTLVKVLDFGVAKAPDRIDTELTQTDTILGSPSYMSLEQLRSSKLVDSRSDIWSLGVILFEMVAGHRPYVGEGPADLALKIAMEPTPTIGPTAHPLDPVIARCLAKEPAGRFQTVGELAMALAPFASRESFSLAEKLGGVTTRMSASAFHSDSSALSAAGPSVDAVSLPTTINSVGVIENPSIASRMRRSKTGAIAIFGGALLAGVVIAVIASRGGQGPSPASGTSDGAMDPVRMQASPPPSADAAAPLPPIPGPPTVPPQPTIEVPVPKTATAPRTNPAAPKKKPVKPLAKPKPRPKSDVDLGKSRI